MDYDTGTVAVTNGSAAVVGSSTNWLTNGAAPGEGGYAIVIIKDGVGYPYVVDAITGEGALTLNRNHYGPTGSGLNYFIYPASGADVDVIDKINDLLESSAYAGMNAAVDEAVEGDFLRRGASRMEALSTLEAVLALLSGVTEASVSAGSTANIGTAASPKVLITGAGATITSLGTTPNCIRKVRFDGVNTLTHHATNLILPGSASITTASGDTADFVSDADGKWRCWQYKRASGQPVATALSVASVTTSGGATLGGALAGTSATFSSGITTESLVPRTSRTKSNVAAGATVDMLKIDGYNTLTQFDIYYGMANHTPDNSNLAGHAVVTFYGGGDVSGNVDHQDRSTYSAYIGTATIPGIAVVALGSGVNVLRFTNNSSAPQDITYQVVLRNGAMPTFL